MYRSHGWSQSSCRWWTLTPLTLHRLYSFLNAIWPDALFVLFYFMCKCLKGPTFCHINAYLSGTKMKMFTTLSQNWGGRPEEERKTHFGYNCKMLSHCYPLVNLNWKFHRLFIDRWEQLISLSFFLCPWNAIIRYLWTCTIQWISIHILLTWRIRNDGFSQYLTFFNKFFTLVAMFKYVE